MQIYYVWRLLPAINSINAAFGNVTEFRPYILNIYIYIFLDAFVFINCDTTQFKLIHDFQMQSYALYLFIAALHSELPENYSDTDVAVQPTQYKIIIESSLYCRILMILQVFHIFWQFHNFRENVFRIYCAIILPDI